MDKIIEVKNLSFEYEEGSKTIDNISFDIEKGTYTTILGHNGSGKSTISKLLMGLLEKNQEILLLEVFNLQRRLYQKFVVKLVLFFKILIINL